MEQFWNVKRFEIHAQARQCIRKLVDCCYQYIAKPNILECHYHRWTNHDRIDKVGKRAGKPQQSLIFDYCVNFLFGGTLTFYSVTVKRNDTKKEYKEAVVKNIEYKHKTA